MLANATDEETRVLLVEDDVNLREITSRELRRAGFNVVEVADGERALAHLKREGADVVLLDLRLTGMDGADVLRHMRDNGWDTEVIVMTAYSTVQSAINCMKLGAYDYIEKPYEMDRLIHAIRKASERKHLRRESSLLRQEIRRRSAPARFVGNSEVARNVVDLANKVAPTEAPVLIVGESGTGKEVLAKLIHGTSPRCKQPFVTVDCGTLQRDLIERELFGHVKGSFTGATDTRHGLVEIAEGGTLFVDEIGDLPLEVQSKFLRVIETGEFRRVGDPQAARANIRVIAATNRDLDAAMRNGTFREDLYHRLNVFPIVVSPLRDRREDIGDLVAYYLALTRAGTDTGVDERAVAALERYHWPGNVRELFNILERSLIISGNGVVKLEQLPKELWFAGTGLSEQPEKKESTVPSLRDVERSHILAVYSQAGGNRSAAARLLGIDRKTLYQKLRNYGVV
jgi:DNA-binding NtrC family response regulator